MMINNFKRIEKKYRINDSVRQSFVADISKFMELDLYGDTLITSAYLDNDYGDIISRSIEKPLYKEKVRIRMYNQPNFDDPVFVELKKKFKGVVYKRRFECSRQGAQSFLNGNSYLDIQNKFPVKNKVFVEYENKKNIQISNEIKAFMERHKGLHPQIFIKCNRKSYKIKDDVKITPAFSEALKSLRITIDSNLQYAKALSNSLDVSCLDFKNLIPTDESIMEIKCVGGLPLWMLEIISKNKILPQSFSKCGTAFQIINNKSHKYQKEEVC